MQPQRSASSIAEETVDIREYLAVIRRRAGVIVLLTVISLGLAIGYSVMKTPIYTAQAEVLVNPPPGNTNQNLSQVISMETEARLVTSAPIATAAGREIDTELTLTKLLKHVSVGASDTSFILDISYWAIKPADAAAGANAFAKAYLDFKQQQGQAKIDEQSGSIEDSITELRRQQREANATLESTPEGTVAHRDAQDQVDRLGIQLGVLVQQLAALPTIVDPGQVILPATAPASPSSPKYPLNAAVGLFFGLFAGIVVAFLLDRGDDRIHRRSDLPLYVKAPVMGYVPHAKGRPGPRYGQLVVDLQPRSPVAEAYRTIRTNILSVAHRRNLKTIAVVSALQREGKSMTSANLSAALGHADRRVLVVSLDIRKPRIHEFLGVPNERGLSEVLAGKLSLVDAIVESRISNVWVLPGGRVPARPAELLASPAMAEAIADVRGKFDFVVLDCPPVLGLADSLSVLPLADAVLLVVQAGSTRGGALLETVDQLERVGVSIDGVVLNDIRVPRGRPGHHGYGYYLAAEDYLRPQEPEEPRRLSRPVRP